MKLLHIDSSITGEASASRQLSAAIVGELTRSVTGIQVLRRDLDADPIPHLDNRLLAAAQPGSNADAVTRADAEKDAAVLTEFLGADIVVIGAPMYNFAISSQLKAWLDRIIVKGQTFAYSETGPRGLVGDKTVIIASTRGGIYAPDTPGEANDFHETHLRAVLGFIGIQDIRIVRAEGIAYGPEQRNAAMRDALASVPGLVKAFVPALAA
jgi:FMN-dependent NADH-azoreductase